jgi:hypothetical protein
MYGLFKNKKTIISLAVILTGFWFGFFNFTQAASTYQFVPTDGRLVKGTATTTMSGAAAAAEGTNTGSWKGTLADDNYHWVVVATTTLPSGFDVQLDLAGVNLNNANKFMIETGFDLDSATANASRAPMTYIQICDWVSSTGVDNVADSNCAGGWRTLNNRKVPIFATSSENSLHYEIYDGYFSKGDNTAYATPLTNFIHTASSSTVTIRYYSDTKTDQSIAIDFLRLYSYITPVYFPSAVVQATSTGVVTGPSSSNVANAVAKDSTYMYVVGRDLLYFRIEKRLLSNGSLVNGFGTSGVVIGDNPSKEAYCIAFDSTYL